MNHKSPSKTPAATDVQGEGDYRAARRYRKGVEKFVATADIDQAARAAAPTSAEKAQKLADADAEAVGKSHVAGASSAAKSPDPRP